MLSSITIVKFSYHGVVQISEFVVRVLTTCMYSNWCIKIHTTVQDLLFEADAWWVFQAMIFVPDLLAQILWKQGVGPFWKCHDICQITSLLNMWSSLNNIKYWLIKIFILWFRCQFEFSLNQSLYAILKISDLISHWSSKHSYIGNYKSASFLLIIQILFVVIFVKNDMTAIDRCTFQFILVYNPIHFIFILA